MCSKCYGRDLGRGSPVNVGEAIGVIAAQSIGEPGTQLTMRTFHIGGAASRTAVQSNVEAKSAGTVRFTADHALRQQRQGRQGGDLAAPARSSSPTTTAASASATRCRTARCCSAADGDTVRAGKQLATWDPHHRPIITEYAGTVKFEHVEEGSTVAKQIDDVTGLSTLVVIDAKRRTTAASKGQRPSVKLINEAGDEVRIAGTDHAVNISFPVGAVIAVRDGQQVQVGEVLARIPQEVSKTRDITGGLPRVAELFEARSPKDAGMLAEVTGTVSFGKDTKGKQRLVITDLDKQEHEYLIAKDKHLLVHDGQVVNKGEMIVDGPVDPHDLLRLLGIEELARYIIDEVQDVYRLQGVKINDKHIEVIVRQMLRRVEIDRSGRDARTSPASRSERAELLEENEKAVKEGKKPAHLPPTCCSASPRPRCRPTRSSPRPPSRRPRAC